MNAKENMLILPILGIMISAVAIYLYDVFEKNNYSFDEFLVEQIQNFKSNRPNIYTDDSNGFLTNGEKSYQSNANGKVTTTSGYDCLSTKGEKICYKLILENVDKISNKINSKGFYDIEPITLKNQSLDSNQIKKVMYAVQNDRPDIFWLSNSFSYSRNDIITTIRLSSTLSGKSKTEAAEKMNNKISEILSKVPNDATDYEKEMYIHDYLVDNCAYSRRQSYDPRVYTAYGCLVNGQAVCEGYSKATQILMCAAGIECRTILGTRGTESHMWNLVKIDGDWYHLDVTWDDREEIKRYNYFNLPDNIVEKDHKIAISMSQDPKNYYKQSSYNFELPTCNSLKENYFNKNAVKILNTTNLTDDTIPKKLVSLRSKKKNVMYIKISDVVGFEKAKDILLANHSKLLFSHIKSANNSSVDGKAFDLHQFEYAECKSQNVLLIQLS